MSSNRFILSRVCVPDYFFPFLPNTLQFFKEESLCPSGFISVYMIYDKIEKKTVSTHHNYSFALKKTKKLNKSKDVKLTLRCEILSIDPNAYVNHIIDYFNIEKLEKIDFYVVINKEYQTIPEYQDTDFVHSFQESILQEAFNQRVKVIEDQEFILFQYELNNDIKLNDKKKNKIVPK